MPSTTQAGSSDDRPDWRRRLEERIGEDPARWLDQDLLEPRMQRIQRREREDTYDEVTLVVDHDVAPPGEQVRALIQGMDRIERVEAWRAAERRLGRGEDGGPRSFVIDLLDERRAQLEEIGERPDRLPCGPWQSFEAWNDGDDVDVDMIRASRSSSVTGSTSAGGSGSSSSGDSSRVSSLGEFATDGGQDGERDG